MIVILYGGYPPLSTAVPCPAGVDRVLRQGCLISCGLGPQQNLELVEGSLLVGRREPSALDPEAVRAAFRANGGYAGVGVEESRAFLRRVRPPGGPDVSHVVDMTVGSEEGVGVRIYHPRPGRQLPAIVWVHGGGWCVGDTDTTDAVCRELAVEVGSVVVSVDHRRSPEHPFPAPLNDVVRVIEWVLTEGRTIGASTERIAVGGESSGANLVLAALLRLQDESGPVQQVVHQVLVVPLVDLDDRPSMRKDADPGLTVADLHWFARQYLPDPTWTMSPYVFPIHADSFFGLPSAIVITAGLDPLCDGGLALAGRLMADGVEVAHLHRPRSGHGMLGDQSPGSPGRVVLRCVAALMRATLVDKQH